MYTSSTVLLVLASLANAGGVVHLPFERHPRQIQANSLAKRSDAVEIPANYSQYYYMAEVKVGTPQKTIKVELDTSTRNVQFIDPENMNCANFTDEYIPYGHYGYPHAENISCWNPTVFNSSASSTYDVFWSRQSANDPTINQEDHFSVQWLDGTWTWGANGFDTLEIGGGTLYNYTIGSVFQGNHTMSVLGLGKKIEDDYFFGLQSVPEEMMNNNLTSFNGFSIYLSGKDSNEGAVIFGGVDHSKYEGTLQTVPVINADDIADYSVVIVNGISLYQGSESVEVASFALGLGLNTDSFYTVLPTPFVDAIAQSIGGERYGKYVLVPCDISGGMTFNLSGSNISIPFEEMVFPLGDDTCHLAITDDIELAPEVSDFFVGTYYLGESFMRAVYVVYNYNSNGGDDYGDIEMEISIAKAKYDASSSSVEAITGSSVPSATPAPYYSKSNESDFWETTVYSNFISASNTSLGGTPITDAPITTDYINYNNRTGNGTTITTVHATGVDSTTATSSGSGSKGGASGTASTSNSQGKKNDAITTTVTPTMVTAAALFFGAFIMTVIA